jgi:hypothetical protein
MCFHQNTQRPSFVAGEVDGALKLVLQFFACRRRGV